MIFSELYSAYYNAVAKILSKALSADVTEKQLRQQVLENAFHESSLTILPSLKSGKWQLLDNEFIPVVENVPTMPLTLLQKRWLKAISLDPRIKLFDVSLPEFSDIDPLFTPDDYRIYDKYSDGDPFENEQYIGFFRMVMKAIKEQRPIKTTLLNRYGKEVKVKFYPVGMEYSEKDDKIRIIAEGCRYRHFNLGRITQCAFCHDYELPCEGTEEMVKKSLTLSITDSRNTLERAMLHFAHFEKQVEKVDDTRYILHLSYYESDETELVIRTLSFGPCVKVIEPQGFARLIRERLIRQKELGVK